MTTVRGLGAYILLGTMVGIQTLKVCDNIPLIEAEPGQTVNMTCNISGLENGLFYWYKMSLGQKVQTVAGGTFGKVKLVNHVSTSTFQVEIMGEGYSLIIKNVSKEDEGTYLCQAGSAYKMDFPNSTNLVVNDSQDKKSTYVIQTSDMKSDLLGTTVTLQCSLGPAKKEKERRDQCADEHDVFWFRAESSSNTGFIYADKKRCIKQTGESCVYTLTKPIQNSSDTGTYYCAVAACGEILFGKGTKVETSQEMYQYELALLGGLLACSVLLNITLIYKRRKPKRLHKNHREDVTATTVTELEEDQPCNEDGEDDGTNYVALNFSSRKPTRWKSKRETSDDCTYSNIKLSMKGSIQQESRQK